MHDFHGASVGIISRDGWLWTLATLATSVVLVSWQAPKTLQSSGTCLSGFPEWELAPTLLNQGQVTHQCQHPTKLFLTELPAKLKVRGIVHHS